MLSRILYCFEHAPSLTSRFIYRSIVGKLNLLEKDSRPDIPYAAHQLARFSKDPEREILTLSSICAHTYKKRAHKAYY